MKNLFQIILIICEVILMACNASGQVQSQKEVLLIGTMHEVPKIIKNSYKPLLKRAIKFQPQAIYVERPMATDTLSLQNVYAEFYAKADSLNRFAPLDTKVVALAKEKTLSAMTKEDFKLLNGYYRQNYDYANAQYYKYLYQHGLDGAPKPTRNENGDITAKLAIHLNIKAIKSMDNQWYSSEYHNAWRACAKASKADGESKYLKKMIKGLKLPAIFSALSGRTGMNTNSAKMYTKYHLINSFQYRQTPCSDCNEGLKYWDLRNLEMARNIGNQVRLNDHQRSVVVVGAGHLFGLREALQREYPDLKVTMLRKDTF